MKGYQKRVIYMKNTGSELFEEAYFVLKCEKGEKRIDTPRMIDEANRIIKENFDNRRGGGVGRLFKYAAPFLVGAALTAMCFILFIVF